MCYISDPFDRPVSTTATFCHWRKYVNTVLSMSLSSADNVAYVTGCYTETAPNNNG